MAAIPPSPWHANEYLWSPRRKQLEGVGPPFGAEVAIVNARYLHIRQLGVLPSRRCLLQLTVQSRAVQELPMLDLPIPTSIMLQVYVLRSFEVAMCPISFTLGQAATDREVKHLTPKENASFHNMSAKSSQGHLLKCHPNTENFIPPRVS